LECGVVLTAVQLEVLTNRDYFHLIITRTESDYLSA
jgi:hypothetical protein